MGIADERLTVEIENTGAWVEPAHTTERPNTGTGLENTRRRLEHFYPANHSFDILKEPGTVRARVVLQEIAHMQRPLKTLIVDDEALLRGISATS